MSERGCCIVAFAWVALNAILLITLPLVLPVLGGLLVILSFNGLFILILSLTNKGTKVENMLPANKVRGMAKDVVELTIPEIEEAVSAALDRQEVEVVFRNRYLSKSNECIVKGSGYMVEHSFVNHGADKPRDHFIRINWVDNV